MYLSYSFNFIFSLSILLSLLYDSTNSCDLGCSISIVYYASSFIVTTDLASASIVFFSCSKAFNYTINQLILASVSFSFTRVSALSTPNHLYYVWTILTKYAISFCIFTFYLQLFLSSFEFLFIISFCRFISSSTSESFLGNPGDEINLILCQDTLRSRREISRSLA